MNEICRICFESGKDHPFITLSCGLCCINCLTRWILICVNEPHYNLGNLIPCISGGCESPINLDNIRPLLPQGSLARIDEALLRVYINKAQDVRRCPNEKCPYAGVIDPVSPCSQNLECMICKTEWRDKQHLTKMEVLKDYLKFQKNDTFSTIWKWVWAKKCPNCGVNIQKNGGCSYMSCLKCQTQFCWDCRFVRYNENPKLHAFYHVFLPLIWAALFLMGLIYLLMSLYQIPFIKIFADEIIFPSLTAIKDGIGWVFIDRWKFWIVLAIDINLRNLLFTKHKTPELKTACIVFIVVCIAIIIDQKAYFSIIPTACVEIVLVSSIFSAAYYFKKVKS